MPVPEIIANGLGVPPSPFPSCPDYQAGGRPLSVRVNDAKRRRDFAAQNLADALRNVELAQFTAQAAENAYRAILAEVEG